MVNPNNTPSPPEKDGRLISIILRKFFNGLGYSGLMFIIYGVISQGTGSVWPILEKWVNPISSFLTIIATLITAASIYFYSDVVTHPPERFSKYVSAPIVIVSSIIALVYLVRNGGDIPPVIVNGFALLGLAGALFRIQPATTE